MVYLIFKYAITSFLVVFISEAAKRSDKLGGLIAALPLVTALVLVGSLKIEVVYFFIGLIPGLFLIPIFFRK
jgi:hypothetical protein